MYYHPTVEPDDSPPAEYPLACPECNGTLFELWIDAAGGELTGVCECGCEIFPNAEDEPRPN